MAMLLAIGFLLACAISTGPLQGRTEIQIVSGNNQTGVYGGFLPEPIVLQVMIGGRPAMEVPVNWYVIPPKMAPHVYSDLCGSPSAIPEVNGTLTDESGQASKQWRGTWVGAKEPVEAQNCKMRVRAISAENDSVLAVDTVFATWVMPGN